ncbi:cell division protein FtsX [Alkaliphilus peptidifermentans]|uniref:Cell division protein FtsX n=1 Tax=Alkaliphilus peptidifermentans DSM 18978 TaxID=1120976 RepID=A0A1G5JTE4_9FIRM|nr:permease-like cell division protein FtsX [Alkaliphilus peptidifermentans]SCY91191.1 cell division protein FtsX [Alkaliphilus peptidifermentans DSM 18978]
MKNIIYNTGYFIKEAKTIVKLDLLSNIFSVFSIGLIFFILAMVISGWWVSNQVIDVIQGEAEISIYFDDNIDSRATQQLVEEIKNIEGVGEVRIVNEGEAYERMVEILGKEATVLEFFDDNPFSPFIEAKINLEEVNNVLKEVDLLTGVSHVRDNRNVLDRLHNIAGLLQILGFLVVAAVGISTLFIISHIIRLGIYNNREQIKTLRLLGAPEVFIAFPFLLEGLFLTVGGGIVASILSNLAINQIYTQMTGPLPFIPLPPREVLVSGLAIMIVTLSITLGIGGSIFGLTSSKSH